MGNTNEKQQMYQEYIKENKTKNIDLQSLDPYSVLNVPKNFTWEQLKVAYREAALKTHPDKEGGNKLIFDYVTQCFKTLATEYKSKTSLKTHIDLKKESIEHYNTSLEKQQRPIIDHNEPFEKKFNKLFEEFKYVDEEMEYGYGSVMSKSSQKREDININNVFKKEKVDNKTFNEQFNKSVPISKEIVKYKEPEPLPAAKNLQFTEIGGKRPDDYSSSVENRTLTYTDYMRAYSGEKLANPDDIKTRKDFKSVDEYEKYRDKKIKKTLTEKERRYMDELKEEEERREYERLERIKEQNNKIQKLYERTSQLLL